MIATMADAHLEWHRNTGVPVGMPGCPQDACHLPDFDTDEEYEAWAAWIATRRRPQTVIVTQGAVPECEHGLSAALCEGPGHYPSDEREW